MYIDIGFLFRREKWYVLSENINKNYWKPVQ